MRQLTATIIGFTGFCLALDLAGVASRSWAGACLALVLFGLAAGILIDRGQA